MYVTDLNVDDSSVYVLHALLIYIILNQNAITESSGENDKLLYGDVQEFSNHLAPLN